MQAGQGAGDGEAQARARIGLGELALDLFEWLAEPPQRIRRDADAGIGDHENDRIRQHVAAHGDPAFVRGELHRVRQQVDEDLLDGAAVGEDGNGASDIGIQRQALVLGAPGHHAQRLRQELRQVELLHVELHAAGLDLRHVEDVVDDFEQVFS